MRWVKIEGAVIGALACALAWQWWDGRLVERLDYPRQTVTSRVRGIDGPAATWDSTVAVVGRKCVIGDEPIDVSGLVSWRSTEPVVTVVEVGSSSATRAPGCEERKFDNEIPESVRRRTEQLLAAVGGRCIHWVITGTETPLNRRIAPATWETEPVWVCRPLDDETQAPAGKDTE